MAKLFVVIFAGIVLLSILILVFTRWSRGRETHRDSVESEATSAMKSNFDIANDAWERAVKAYPPPDGLTRMPEPMRALVLVWTSAGIVGNGGFEYLFESPMEGDPELVLTERAYVLLGDQALTDAFVSARKRALGVDGKIDRTKFSTLKESEKRELDIAYYAAKENLRNIAAAFVKQHGL